MILRTAIIGMGKMGHIRKRVIDMHPGFRLVAVCDVDEAVRGEFPGLYFSSNWKDILEKELDVIVICTYNHIAPEVICNALKKGLHVFCEKPPGRTVDDVKRIMEAESQAGNKVVKFGFNHRFHYSIMEAKAIIDSGRYGRILWARGIYGKAGDLKFEDSWRSNSEYAGGGILLDQGIHMVDLLRYFMGDFVEVKSFVENYYWNKVHLEDNAFALLKTGEGMVAMLHSSATHWKHKFSLDLFMENGYININGILTSTRSYGEESITFARRQFEDEARAFGRPREETIYFDKDDSWKLEIEEFYDCITRGGKNYMGSTADALRVMQLIEKIYEQSK